MPTFTPVPVYRPASPRWVMVGAAGFGGFLLSMVASHAHVSPLWVVPVVLVVGHFRAKAWVRRRYHDVTAKPCPGCGKPPAMVVGVDGDHVHIRVWCRSRPGCPVVGGVEVRATCTTGPADTVRPEALRVACQRAADAWSSDDMQTTLRRQARD